MSDHLHSGKIINKTISINAPVSKVWKALTNPEIMKLWISDSEINVLSEWKAGSSIIFRGDLHGAYFENKGVILKLVPEKIFEYSYLSNISNLPDSPENYSVVRFELAAENDQTILSFTQTNFIAYTSYEHSNFYWNSALQVIKRLVEN